MKGRWEENLTDQRTTHRLQNTYTATWKATAVNLNLHMIWNTRSFYYAQEGKIQVRRTESVLDNWQSWNVLGRINRLFQIPEHWNQSTSCEKLLHSPGLTGTFSELGRVNRFWSWCKRAIGNMKSATYSADSVLNLAGSLSRHMHQADNTTKVAARWCAST
jgi:hypothetical protein